MAVTPTDPDRDDRAQAALYGLALGDALGMPSQTLTCADIKRHYGVINDFVDPIPDHPVSHGLHAGQVTDDTEQALLLARRLVDEPDRFDPEGWAHDLLAWEADVKRRRLRDILGPSSKAALEAIMRGVDPAQAARKGTTNGAAMRITPLGIAVPCDDLHALVAAVAATCRVTHNTGEAIAGAAAVAAAISARIDDKDARDCLALALGAAELGQNAGYAAGVDDMAGRIKRAVALADTGISPQAFAQEIGTSVASHESIPAAFGLMHLAGGEAWQAACLAANIGDDTDTIGAIATALCAAASGMAGLPPDKLAKLRRANSLDIAPVAADLLALRQRAASRSVSEVAP